MKEVRKCEICGNVFVARTAVNVYCSKECQRRGNNLRYNERQKAEREKDQQFKKAGKPKENKKKSGIPSIAEIDTAAKKVGLSYGKYVAKMKIK